MTKLETQMACHPERSGAQRNAVEGSHEIRNGAVRGLRDPSTPLRFAQDDKPASRRALLLRHPGFGLLSSFDIRHSSFSPSLEWQFGGWLQSLPPAFAWTILGLAALAGLALIVFLYRRTLRELTPAPRIALTALRVALLLALLLVLANPSRVERPPRDDSKTPRHLAVVVDRSASMDAVDNRNETRLKNALRIWKLHIEETGKAFDRVDHYRFAGQLEKAATFDDAMQSGAPGEETQLWNALHSAMADSPAGVVCLTDGLDTSGRDASEVVSEAQLRGVSLYFVPARNRSRPVDLLSIRDVKTPSKVLRKTKFTASAILEISALRDRPIPVELWSGERKLASTTLQARAGWNVLPWSPEISAGETGAMPLEFRLGEGAAQEIAASTTQVVERTSLEVLYYQGALQWGYRFLLGALESDPSFKLTSIINPALGVKITSSSGAKLADLPDIIDALKRFQIIILAHVLADQLSAKQQQALADYAKGGGGVLFIAPDSEATERFSGTKLEEMLPIVFDRSKPTVQHDAARDFRERMSAAFEPGGEDAALGEGRRQQDLPELLPFEVPPGSASVLKRDQPKPMFSNYARARRAKPAAEILAIHPRERTAENAPRILLARQQFGAGFTAAMTTDLLWRWKMSLPSESRAAETFWQQLLLSLAPASGEGLRIVKTSGGAAVNRAASILVSGVPGGSAPQIEAVSPEGKKQTLAAIASPNGWETAFTPDREGRWQLLAADSAGNRARITLPVGAEVRTAERANTPPDIEGLRRVAEATGGALIETAPVFPAEKTAPVIAPEIKTIQPLWNQPWLLGILLGLYATELIARRRMKLL